MGDPVRLVMLKAVLDEIKTKNLLPQFRESGRVLLNGLLDMEVCVYSLYRLPLSGRLYQDASIRTPLSGHLFQDISIRTPLSGHLFQDHFWMC